MSELAAQARSQSAGPGLRQINGLCNRIPELWGDYKESAYSLQSHNNFCLLLFILWLIHCGSSPLFYSSQSWVPKGTIHSTESVQLVLSVTCSFMRGQCWSQKYLVLSQIFGALLSSKKKIFSPVTSAPSLWKFVFTVCLYFVFVWREKSAVCCWNQQVEKNNLLTNDIFCGLLNSKDIALLIPHFPKIMEPMMKVGLENTFSST